VPFYAAQIEEKYDLADVEVEFVHYSGSNVPCKPSHPARSTSESSVPPSSPTPASETSLPSRSPSSISGP